MGERKKQLIEWVGLTSQEMFDEMKEELIRYGARELRVTLTIVDMER